MDKSAAIRLIPGSPVTFRGRRHSIISAKSGLESDAPFFRLRSLDDGGLTGLISYRMLEPALEESAHGIVRKDADDRNLRPRTGA
jgi:hypothetical protein